PSFGRSLPLRDGIWDIGVRPVGAAGTELIVPGYDHSRLAEVAERKVSFGLKTYSFSTSGYDSPIIEVAPALRLAEQGRVQRRLLRGVYSPMQLKRPMRDAVVFVS